MSRVLNLMAFVIFATTLFMRSVDPVIPQIAQGLNVTPTTAALLSTGFTLPYALIQPVLGALADMFSKTRLIALCMLIVGITTLACGLVTNFETLMALRVVAGITAGGVFPDCIGCGRRSRPGAAATGRDRTTAVCGDERQFAGSVRCRCYWRSGWLARRILHDRRNRSDCTCGRHSRVSQYGGETRPLRPVDADP